MLQFQAGDRHSAIEFPKRAEVFILKADGLPVLTDPMTEIENTINHLAEESSPLGSFLSKAVHDRVSIAITDAVHHENLEVLLPSMLAQLYRKNEALKPSAVTIIVDEGIKRSPQARRFKKLFQTVNTSGCRVTIHDPVLQPLVDLGVTSRGTPVRVNSELADADLKIVIDRIKPSPLFGFLESVLRMARCCMSIDSIESLAAMGLAAGAGHHRDGHPLLGELREIVRMIAIDGGLAGISNPTGETIRIMADEPSMIIRRSAALYRRHYDLPVSEPFDIAVINFGRHRPERLFSSVQDGLLVAARLLKEGGQALIMGDDTQRVGQDIFFDFVCHALSPSALIKTFVKSRNQLGADGFGQSHQKFASTARGLEKLFGGEVIRCCQFRAADPSTVLAEWADEYEAPPRIAIVPEGSGTFCYPE